MYFDNDTARFWRAEEQRLLNELATQKMSWRKVGKMIRLNALVRARFR